MQDNLQLETLKYSNGMNSMTSLDSFASAVSNSSNFSNVSNTSKTCNFSDIDSSKPNQTNIESCPPSHTKPQETMQSKYLDYSFSNIVMWRRFESSTLEYLQRIISIMGDCSQDIDVCISDHCTELTNALVVLYNQGKLECTTVHDFMALIIARTQAFFDANGIEAQFIHGTHANEIGQPSATLIFNNVPVVSAVYAEDDEFPQITSDDFFFRRLNQSKDCTNFIDEHEKQLQLSSDIVFRAFQYMALNNLSYSFISTSAFTRFLSRDTTNNRIVYVSPAIDHKNSTNRLVNIAGCLISISIQAITKKHNDNRSILPNAQSYNNPLSFWMSAKKNLGSGLVLNIDSHSVLVDTISSEFGKAGIDNNLNEEKQGSKTFVSSLPIGPASTNTFVVNGALRIGTVISVPQQTYDENSDVSSISALSDDSDSEYSREPDIPLAALEKLEALSLLDAKMEQKIPSPKEALIEKYTDPRVELEVFGIDRVFTPPPIIKSSQKTAPQLQNLGDDTFYQLEMFPVATPSVHNLSSMKDGYPGNIQWWKIFKAKKNIQTIKFKKDERVGEGEINITVSDVLPKDEVEYDRLERNETRKRGISRAKTSANLKYENSYSGKVHYNKIQPESRLDTKSVNIAKNKNSTAQYDPYFSIKKNHSHQQGSTFQHCVAPIERNTTKIVTTVKIIDTSMTGYEEKLKEYENEAQMCEYFAGRPHESQKYVPTRYAYGSVLGLFVVLAIEKCGKPMTAQDLISTTFDNLQSPQIKLNQRVCEEMHEALSGLHAMRILHHDILLEHFTIDDRYDGKAYNTTNIKLSNFGKSKLYVRLYKQASQEEHDQLDDIFKRVLKEARQTKIIKNN